MFPSDLNGTLGYCNITGFKVRTLIDLKAVAFMAKVTVTKMLTVV